MISTPLQPQYKTRINVRPVKHAYFVRDNDKDALVRVMEYACTQWGGIRNLIIPVRADLSIVQPFEYFLKHHEPDVFVTFLKEGEGDDEELREVLQSYLIRLFPQRAVEVEVGDEFVEHDRSMHALGVVPPEQLKSAELTSHNFFGPEEDRWLLLALFGAIYRSQYQDYSKETRLKNDGVIVGGYPFWYRQSDLSPFSSILNLTGYGIVPYLAEGGSDSTIFDVVLVNSVNSMCLYWNLRASRESEQFYKDLGRRTLMLPEKLLTERNALWEMLHLIKEKLHHQYLSSNLHVSFVIETEADKEKVLAAVSGMRGFEQLVDERVVVNLSSNASADSSTVRTRVDTSLKFKFGVPAFSKSYREGTGPRTAVNVGLNYGANEVFFTPPEGFSNRDGYVTALDVESDVWQRYPKDSYSARNIQEEGWFSRYGLTYLAYTPDRPTYLALRLPDEWETVSQYFRGRGYEVRRSRDGVYADGVINLLGGISNVGALASKAAYVLIDALALKSTKKIAQRIAGRFELPEGSEADILGLLREVEVVPELKRVPKTHRQLAGGAMRPFRKELLGLLSRLSERQILKRGFHLPCPHCDTPSWYPLLSIQERLQCPGCSEEFPLPVEHPPGGEIQWEYTLNSLINRAVDQDALPPILALNHLTKGQQACCLIPGLELLQGNNTLAEFDFIFLSGQQLYVGECKAGRMLAEKDFETARRAANVGIREFYFCTVTRWDESSARGIEALRRELQSNGSRMGIRSLDGDDLLGEAL
jgi:hypothetical protein